jgi:ribosome maturation factor RimP
MAVQDREASLRADLAPILLEMGYALVELHSTVVNGRTHLNLVIYREAGITVDDCAEAHRVVRPRAELLLDDRDLAIQVASPGIDRVIKDDSEFAVFTGRGVRVLLRSGDEWIGGIVDSADDTTVTIRTGDDCRSIAYADIQKARLDHAQEVV